jgi:propionyl-CoA synthetase
MAAHSGYASSYAEWRRDPTGWWEHAAEAIHWEQRWDRVFDRHDGPHGRWFKGGILNTSFNCLDRHVAAGRHDQAALIWDSPMTGQVVRISYLELLNQVAKLAGALAALGVNKGDRVIIYMPMVPESVVAMLACARLGAVHCVVFGGFAAPELAKRIDDVLPRAIVSASCGLEPNRVVEYKPLLDHALQLSTAPEPVCVILQRPMLTASLKPGRDYDYAASVDAASPHAAVAVQATDPLYILHTSGTTARPKGIVRDNGGHAVALFRSMDLIYGTTPGSVIWTASDVGWVVGHSYIVYGPLLAGLTTVMYEGKPVGTPDAGAFWRVCQEHRVQVLFTAPTALRAIRQQDSVGSLTAQYDLSALQALYLAGERCDPPTSQWISKCLHRPVIDHWWQTETGWPITACLRGVGHLPTQIGAAGRPCPGFDVAALDDNGAELSRGEAVGNLAIRLPLPPGCAVTLWGDDTRFRHSYLTDFAGWYRTGDAGRVDASGDVWVMGRTDDVMNVAGHRLSSAAIEEVIAAHADVAECAVVGAADELKGQIPVALVVLRTGATVTWSDLTSALIEMVRERIGPVVSFRDVFVVPKLPKTRSGKILRATIRALIDGGVAAMPSTIEDPTVLPAIQKILHPTQFFHSNGNSQPHCVKAIVVEKSRPARVAVFDPEGLMPGDVTIRVSHSTVNYKDALALVGKIQIVRRFPMIPGIDLAGVVESSQSNLWKSGERVLVTGWGMGESHFGGFAELARVPAAWPVRIPEALTAAQAMAIGTAGFTAMLCILALERHGVTPADGPVLVTGAAGGVGSVTVSLLATLGWQVIASTGRTNESGYLRQLGAAHIMDRAELSSAGKPLGKERWAAAVDCVGSHTLANVLSQIKRGGAVAACGLAQGMDLPASLAPFILRNVALLGVDSVMCSAPLRAQAWSRIAVTLERARLTLLTQVISLDEVIPTATKILAGEIRGRIVVSMS